MKITIKTLKPRNPLVVAAKLRQAGAHGGHQASRRKRREGKQELRRMLSGHDNAVHRS
ncbi:hypothetical protein ACFQUU_09685 [Herbaspirillum sp. GCM10030257]|uniref:hypothetical protein n=1 Tax=Herbaspirillum sp. GCM10030257 TaxID=3273393 RepID=UPI0036172BEA